MLFPHVLDQYANFMGSYAQGATGREYVKQVLTLGMGFRCKRGSAYLSVVKISCAGKCGNTYIRGAKLMTKVTEKITKSISRHIRMVLGAGLIASSLLMSGCSSTSLSLPDFGFGGGSSSESAEQSSAPVQKISAQQTAPISFAPVFGPPVKIAQKISGALASEAQVRSIRVVQGGSSPDAYTVRGYLSASTTKQGTKLAYVWDVTNSAGKRAHRIKGEQIVTPKKNARDPWSLIDQKAIQSIAQNTTSRLATWLPGNSGSGGLVQNASLNSTSRAGSAVNGPVIAIIPEVKGAPGDGSQALANALRKQLLSRGIKISSAGKVANPYKVQGIVNLASAGSNQQRISIEWIVKDPRNKRLGTVSQKNTIPAGSLDGKWGQTADAAAAAAAQGIAKLLVN